MMRGQVNISKIVYVWLVELTLTVLIFSDLFLKAFDKIQFYDFQWNHVHTFEAKHLKEFKQP